VNGRGKTSTMSTPDWSLRFLGGALRGRSIALRAGPNTIGSAADCDVMLPAGDVQPHHALLQVGSVAAAFQALEGASSRINGEAVEHGQRRSLVAGDVLEVGQLELQFERAHAVERADAAMFAEAGPQLAADSPAQAAGAQAASPRQRWTVITGVVALVAAALLGGLALGGRTGHAGGDPPALSLDEIQRLLKPYPEMEAVAAPGGRVGIRGFVATRADRQALQQLVAPYGSRITLSALPVEELLEQARRFVSDPAVQLRYEGEGRLVATGTVEEGDARGQLKRMADDLYPVLAVTDKVQYRSADPKQRALEVAQQGIWQGILPAAVVGVTLEEGGLRSVQLANGARYYEGSTFRSGAQLLRIEPDGNLVFANLPADREPHR